MGQNIPDKQMIAKQYDIKSMLLSTKSNQRRDSLYRLCRSQLRPCQTRQRRDAVREQLHARHQPAPAEDLRGSTHLQAVLWWMHYYFVWFSLLLCLFRLKFGYIITNFPVARFTPGQQSSLPLQQLHGPADLRRPNLLTSSLSNARQILSHLDHQRRLQKFPRTGTCQPVWRQAQSRRTWWPSRWCQSLSSLHWYCPFRRWALLTSCLQHGNPSTCEGRGTNPTLPSTAGTSICRSECRSWQTCHPENTHQFGVNSSTSLCLPLL